MGVSIYGVSIPKRSKKKQNQDLGEVFCYKGFERSLPSFEKTWWDYEKDQYSKNGLNVSYGYYNSLREEMARVFLNTTPERIWNNCGKLKKHQRYGRNLYFIINFADNEGYIGPTAVKKMRKYLTAKRVQKALGKVKDKQTRKYLEDLINCIKETASMPNGYICFSWQILKIYL